MIIKIQNNNLIEPNVSGLCVVALSRNLKLTTTLDRDITQNPCYVPLNLERYESIYGVELESIYTVGLPTGSSQRSLFNWFNSCQTIKDISKSNNLKKLTIDRLDITFKLS